MFHPRSFASFLPAPENLSALTAVLEWAQQLTCAHTFITASPLFLHGPPGCGKSHLVEALAHEVACVDPALKVQIVRAGDLPLPFADEGPTLEDGFWVEALSWPLLAIEDVQALGVLFFEPLVQLLEARMMSGLPTVFTALVGPCHLSRKGAPFPARLTSRFATGLVIGIAPMRPATRLAFLKELAKQRQLRVDPELLPWLAEHLSCGGRQLESAIAQLDSLTRVSRQPLKLADVAAHFHDQAQAGRLTVERIAAKVGDVFHVEAAALRTSRRLRSLLVPRQVSMYLARRLTGLSLEQIGTYFGRDHTTVLHACHKVAQALTRDAQLSGTIRQLQADLC